MNRKGWIGVDLDGTLAEYTDWVGPYHIGAPIPTMVNRVRQWRSEGLLVKIFTARVSGNPDYVATVRHYIEEWCREHLGEALEITNIKDYGMVELWDDRAVQVVPNTGMRADGRLG